MVESTQNSSASTNMATTARERFHGMWTSIRSLTFDDEGSWKKRVDNTKTNSDQTLESMIRVMFGSCNGSTNHDATTSNETVAPEQEVPTPDTAKDHGVFAYNKEEHARAAQAVTSLRELQHSSSSSSPKSPERPIPKPFPVSSPNKSKLPLEEVPAVSRLAHDDNDNMLHHEFDDGISAISAHTLDEMARQDAGGLVLNKQQPLNPVRSDLTTDSSLFPASRPSRNSGTPNNTSSSYRITSRQASQNSKRSYNTRSTKSTHTTTDFEQTWRKEEQKYWQNVVQEEEDEPDGDFDMTSHRQMALWKRMDSSAKLSPSGTLTTASSSGPFGRHPHDTTFTLDPSDCIPMSLAIDTDPDRIICSSVEVLALKPGDEIGEI